MTPDQFSLEEGVLGGVLLGVRAWKMPARRD